eukprot:scaffold2691_cov417-Prasinococcus_capsulatus_cf.AAC.22
MDKFTREAIKQATMPKLGLGRTPTFTRMNLGLSMPNPGTAVPSALEKKQVGLFEHSIVPNSSCTPIRGRDLTAEPEPCERMPRWRDEPTSHSFFSCHRLQSKGVTVLLLVETKLEGAYAGIRLQAGKARSRAIRVRSSSQDRSSSQSKSFSVETDRPKWATHRVQYLQHPVGHHYLQLNIILQSTRTS